MREKRGPIFKNPVTSKKAPQSKDCPPTQSADGLTLRVTAEGSPLVYATALNSPVGTSSR